MIEQANTLFPEPLSPTNATISPGLIVKDTLSTTLVVFESVVNATDKSSICSRGDVIVYLVS